jgi:hypothetical protein
MHLQMKMLLKLPCHRAWRPLLRIDQCAQGQQRRELERRAFHNLHPTAELFIQHPLGNKQLILTRKGNLHLMKPERGTLPHQRHRLAVVRMMRIVNLRRAQNMGSV